MSSKANYESLASIMPRNEQEADAVVDPVIAEMNARLEAEFAAENEHTTQATRTVFCVGSGPSLTREDCAAIEKTGCSIIAVNNSGRCSMTFMPYTPVICHGGSNTDPPYREGNSAK